MHRSHLSVLVIFAAMAACSKRDDTEGRQVLSQDRALVAQLELDKDARRPAQPDACGPITVAAHPSVASQQQAEELTRQADVAEMHGNLQEARALLLRASALDATNKSAAYHLGRTNEALGDRTAAMAAYCRYLALAPTKAESLEARQRLTDLAKSSTRVGTGKGGSVPIPLSAPVAPSQKVARARQSSASTVVSSAPLRRSTPARVRTRATAPTAATTSAANESPPPAAAEPTQPNVVAASSTTADGDVAATPRPTPPADQPATASGSQRRAASGVQGTILGAAAGAILGAATGRSVKSAVIGAAAGGAIGTVMGRASRPRTPGWARS